ncbi:MAG: carbohydrate ABC transporter permease [Treponema sp.]|jgi:putative aldouronate transport system permease protein|nr:carbohydrate ABC transporter permease [Treponema sp.]
MEEKQKTERIALSSRKSNVVRFTQIKPVTNIIFHLLLFAFSLMCVIPFLLVVSISLSSESSIYEYGYRLIPKTVSFEGFEYLIEQRTMILRALGMSVLVTVLGTLIGITLNTTMGYGLSRPEYKLRKLYIWLVFIPMVFSGGLVSSYFITSQFLHLKNTIWVLILPLSVSSFNIIICRTFFRTNIPDSVIESAKIDGASQFVIYFRIVLPLSLPVIATVGLFMSFGYWNDWFQALLYLDNRNLYTLQALLNKILVDLQELANLASLLGAVSYAEQLARIPQEAARMAVVVIIVLPIACAYPFFQRYFVTGLTVGSVKG